MIKYKKGQILRRICDCEVIVEYINNYYMKVKVTKCGCNRGKPSGFEYTINIDDPNYRFVYSLKEICYDI